MKRVLICLSLILLAGCSRYDTKEPSKELISLTLSHYNGFSESINSKDRISNYKETDFLKPQPFQKVSRVYNIGKDGKSYSLITSYYPSGQIKQYLEAVDNRAFGKYQEWHPNGNLKLEANVLGGIADLSISSEKSWLFNGTSKAWNEEGHLVAEIPYVKGVLEGHSTYYYPCGAVQKIMPYVSGRLEGNVTHYRENSEVSEKICYHKGILNGLSASFWNVGCLKSSEMYENGYLTQGTYFNSKYEPIASIVEGVGCKAIFCEDYLDMLKTYRDGKEEGLVQIFGKNGKLKKQYYIKNGLKNNEEIVFSSLNRKLMSLRYKDGIVQGVAKTWYEDGTLESMREMLQNKKNGEMRAWYQDGHLMLIEEYQLDRLITGEYYKKGETKPTSRVINGKGTATLYDGEGNFLRKVTYVDGKIQA